ncbi:MAG: O-antigen ligase family protein [Patescibacteria group bacterium]
MFSPKKFFIYLAGYFAVRVFTYFFTPVTPLVAGSIVNIIVAVAVLALAMYWLIKKDWRGWLIVAGEIIFCGSGNMLSVGSVSLRTLLLIASVGIYFIMSLREGRRPTKQSLLIFALIIWAGISAFVGYHNHHVLSLIISDFIPYLFLLYYFPLRDLLHDEKFKREVFNMIAGALIGCGLITVFTSLMYGFGIFVLQDNYYHWFRDVCGGKITDTGANFFRVILNEQLLLVPVALYFITRVKQKIEFVNDMALPAAAAILSVNLTRIYYLALLVGLCFAFTKTLWRRWLINSAVILLSVFGWFTFLHVLVGGLANPGWEYFGLRATSIVAPHIEESSLSRMLLLPKILEKISSAPIFGTGLGDTVTVWSPVYNELITTPHFDWGYLEILAEMGATGLIIWFALIMTAFYHIKSPNGHVICAPLVALLVINITSPALFHVFGFIFLAIILAHASSPQSSSPSHTGEQTRISTAD